MRQSLDNRTQSLEVDTRLSHSKRDLWRPSREDAYLSHIWWHRSRGQYCNIGPRRRASLHFGSEKWGKFCALTPRVRSALYQAYTRGMKKLRRAIQKSTKNQAGMNLTPPPRSQNSHV